MCTPFRRKEDVSTNGGIRRLRTRQTSFAGGAILLTTVLSGHDPRFAGAFLLALISMAGVRRAPAQSNKSERFVQMGGMIGFFLEDNKVRFDINLNAAERSNLKISASLLTLAKTVIGSPKGN
jgi:hypothetical protein